MASPDKRIVPTIKELSALGASEVLVRVSSYNYPVGARGPENHMIAVEWQAIVKHQNASLPWAVAVRKDADEAYRDACLCFAEMNDKPHKKAALHKPKPAPKAAPVVDEDDGLDLI